MVKSVEGGWSMRMHTQCVFMHFMLIFNITSQIESSKNMNSIEDWKESTVNANNRNWSSEKVEISEPNEDIFHPTDSRRFSLPLLKWISWSNCKYWNLQSRNANGGDDFFLPVSHTHTLLCFYFSLPFHAQLAFSPQQIRIAWHQKNIY